jgi:hypothetical protein
LRLLSNRQDGVRHSLDDFSRREGYFAFANIAMRRSRLRGALTLPTGVEPMGE